MNHLPLYPGESSQNHLLIRSLSLFLGAGLIFVDFGYAGAKGKDESGGKIVIQAPPGKQKKGIKSLKNVQEESREKNSGISREKKANDRLHKSKSVRKSKNKSRTKLARRRGKRTRTAQWMAKRAALAGRLNASKNKKNKRK